MIQELHISNMAVIEDTTLEFTSPYTALIGETGAGKSLVVNSLSLLSGERSDFSLVRDKTKKATVSGLFSLSDEFIEKHPEVKDHLGEGNTLIVKRVLSPDKSTRCYLNDDIVSLNEFKRVTSHLIDIHSQNGKNDLLDETKQIRYVDLYGKKKLTAAKEDYQKAYKAWKNKEKELSDLISQDKELDRDYLTFQIFEIEKYKLQPDEIESLNAEYESLRSFDKLKEKYDTFLADTENTSIPFSEQLSHAISRLSSFRDTELSEIASKALEDATQLQEDLSNLDLSFKDLAADPRRLDYINERLFSLKGLQRKYGKTTKEILDKLEDYKAKLARLDSFEEEKANLENEIDALRKDVLAKGKILSQSRVKMGAELSSDIGKEMADLGLRKNAFRVDDKEVDPNEEGIDKITFRVSLNAGLDESSLAKAASGGETSRLMLALKVVLNSLDPYDVLVFDEIDTGVSGKTADLIARKIKKVSSFSPIIVISHLPQVVASCLSAVKIEKKSKADTTITTAKTLNKDEIVSTVARMLSGDKITPSAMEQAKLLMDEYQNTDR